MIQNDESQPSKYEVAQKLGPRKTSFRMIDSSLSKGTCKSPFLSRKDFVFVMKLLSSFSAGIAIMRTKRFALNPQRWVSLSFVIVSNAMRVMTTLVASVGKDDGATHPMREDMFFVVQRALHVQS